MHTPPPTPLTYATPTTPVSRQYRWWVVFMLWFICFFNYADRQAIYAVFPKLSSEFGFDAVKLGLIGSAFMWVYAFGAPFAGYIADRVKRTNLILGGCFFWSVITVTTSWCSTLWQFVTVRALEGLGETFYFPASMSLVSDYHGPETRSKALSFHQSSVYAGTILGSWIAALMAEWGDWRHGFYLFGGCGMVLVIVLMLFLREPPRAVAVVSEEPRAHRPGNVLEYASAADQAGRDVAFRTLLKPSAILLMLAFLCANFVATIFLTWTPTFLVTKFHFKLSAAGLSGSLFIHLASAIGAPLGGILADRLRRTASGGRMIVQAGGLLLGCGFLFLVGTTTSRTVLLVSMTIFGFGKGLYDSNIFASLYDVVEPRARATAAGIMNTVGWGGGALGPLAVGWFTRHGRYTSEVDNMSHAIAATSVVYVVAAILLMIVAFRLVRADQIDAK
ncbi:MAG TPA: MFS transporter [Tepidisphaeraceae bacterium]|jgi:MFS family permease